MMSFPREHLLFTLWYLKESDLVRQDENSNFVVTVQGVDYVEKNLPSYRVLYNLLKSAESGDVERTGSGSEDAIDPQASLDT